MSNMSLYIQIHLLLIYILICVWCDDCIEKAVMPTTVAENTGTCYTKKPKRSGYLFDMLGLHCSSALRRCEGAEQCPQNKESEVKHYPGGSELPKQRHNIRKRSAKTVPKVWGHWGHWSPCSRTCDQGKMTRWRHCVSGGCVSGEKEAQIKTCRNPAC